MNLCIECTARAARAVGQRVELCVGCLGRARAAFGPAPPAIIQGPPERWRGEQDGFPRRATSSKKTLAGGSLLTLDCGHVFRVPSSWFFDGWGEALLACPAEHQRVTDRQGIIREEAIPDPSAEPPAQTTEAADVGSDSHFRSVVRSLHQMGFGRMAQIVDEESRRVDPVRGGGIVICGQCKTLINTRDGSPR